MTPIKLMFFLIAATFLCCCNETKPKKVEMQQIIPATDTIPPINKKETTKIIKKIPPKKPRKIIQRVRNEDKKNRNDTIVKSASDNKIPAVWEKTFSSDKKWMELYSLSKTSFITGWKNEFDSNPNASISEFELLYAYRSRMEKAFYQTPEFIEFGVQHLASDSDFISFKKEYHSHIKPD